MSVPARDVPSAAPASLGEAVSACPACGAGRSQRLFHKRFVGKDWFLARCPECGQHYTDPLPTLDEIASFYTGGGYHQELLSRAGSLAAFGPKFRSYIDWIAPWVQPGGRSLDIGCSTGLFPFLLAERGFAAEGIELNPATAEFGRREFGVTIRNQPLETADYAPGSFRLVSMTDVLEHSLNPATTLARVHNILEPGGFVLITFPDIQSVESRYYRACSRLARREWLWQNCHIPEHTWEFTQPTAEALFRRSGFDPVAFRRTHLVLDEERTPLLALLTLPSHLLMMPALARRFGTQMEFLIRKRVA